MDVFSKNKRFRSKIEKINNKIDLVSKNKMLVSMAERSDGKECGSSQIGRRLMHVIPRQLELAFLTGEREQ